jgi:hypothetical protein
MRKKFIPLALSALLFARFVSMLRRSGSVGDIHEAS